MAPTLKSIGLALIFSVIVGMDCQCSKNQLKVTQYRTQELLGNKPVWRVKITNGCPCTQLDVKLSCKGFEAVQDIRHHPKPVLAKSGGECLLNNGQPIYAYEDFIFTYACSTRVPLRPLSSHIACS